MICPGERGGPGPTALSSGSTGWETPSEVGRVWTGHLPHASGLAADRGAGLGPAAVQNGSVQLSLLNPGPLRPDRLQTPRRPSGEGPRADCSVPWPKKAGAAGLHSDWSRATAKELCPTSFLGSPTVCFCVRSRHQACLSLQHRPPTTPLALIKSPK